MVVEAPFMTTTRPGFSTRHFGCSPNCFQSSTDTKSYSAPIMEKLSRGSVRILATMWIVEGFGVASAPWASVSAAVFSAAAGRASHTLTANTTAIAAAIAPLIPNT